MSFSSTLKAALTAFVIGAGVVGVAHAGDRMYSATLAQPLAGPERPIAGGVVWRCDGVTCTAPAARGLGVSACRQLGRRTSSVITAFGSGEATLSVEELARCNGDRAAAPAAAPAAATAEAAPAPAAQ